MRALVLSGGGGLGAYQVGALQHLLGNLGRRHQIITGVSVGCINGAAVAMAPLGQEADAVAMLTELWSDLRTEQVMDARFLQPASLLWQPSTHGFEPLERLLNELLDVDRMRASGRVYRAVAVDICSGEFRCYGEDMPKPQLVRGMLGSSATPILHPNIRTPTGQVLYDGGIRDVSPIRQAIRLGATEVDLVLCQSPNLKPWEPEPDRVWNTGLRVFDVMFREIVEADLDRVELYNAAVEARHPKGVGKRIVTMRVVRPAQPLPGDAAKFEPDQSADLMAQGRADAQAVF